jgi:hypothetical protein
MMRGQLQQVVGTPPRGTRRTAKVLQRDHPENWDTVGATTHRDGKIAEIAHLSDRRSKDLSPIATESTLRVEP